MPETGPDAPFRGGDQSVSELTRNLSQQTAKLIRQELQLAQLELKEKGKRGGIGAGFFGGSGLIAVFAVGALIAAAILALAEALDAWLSALIVAALLGAIAGAFALTGRKQLEHATPPAPEQAIESTKETVQEVKERTGRA